MENKAIQTQSETGNVNILKDIYKASNSLKIANSDYEQISNCLKEVFFIIGISSKNLPDKEAKEILIRFIRVRLATASLSEIKLAFVYAIEKRINVDLSLYGETFSPKLLMDVFSEYLKCKKSILERQPKEQGFTNNQTVDVILKMLPKETVESIKSIGKVDKKPTAPIRVPTENELIIQDILREFDELHRNTDYKGGVRSIEYNGKELTQSEFLEVRLKEINEV